MSDELSRYFSQIGQKGGKASAKALSKRQRVERAKKARAAQLKTRTRKAEPNETSTQAKR